MLNFNLINNSNTYPIAMNGGNFASVPTTVSQQNNINYLNNSINSIAQNGTQSSVNWSRSNNSSHPSIDCNESTEANNNNNNNLSNEAIRNCDHPKDYLQTTINYNESDERSTLETMGNYLQQKGSENVKRFSVNNLLQLANNCRALANEQRQNIGKCK